MKCIGYLPLFIVFLSLPGFHCKKHKIPQEQLPPETHTGRGTFGCLINGIVFKPKGTPLAGPILSCAYQFINGGYYFQVHARQDIGSQTLSAGLFTDSLEILQGKLLKLSQRNLSGNAYGQHGHYDLNSSPKLFYTGSINSGELKIDFLDTINRVVSGTFWFDAINSGGEKVQVRSGRFDVKYSL
jgi:hypothetical protein